MSKLSGLKDVDREILRKLDDRELLKACAIDKYTWNTVCDDAFLKRRLIEKYPEIERYKSKTESWKQFFLRAVRTIALLREQYGYDYSFGDFEIQYDLFLKFYEKDYFDYFLNESAKKGELALVIWSFKKGGEFYYEPLKSASEKGYLNVVKYLVENGGNIEEERALVAASLNGHLEIVKYLLSKGANIHVDNDNSIKSASANGYLETVKYLVENGANFRIGNDESLSLPLSLASVNGHLEVVKYLVERGADIHAENENALRWASNGGQLEVVKYLVERGADIYAENDGALLAASEHGHLDVVKYLKSKLTWKDTLNPKYLLY